MIACAVAVLVLAGSGLLALAASARPRLATSIGAVGAVAAALLGLPPALMALSEGATARLDVAWTPPLEQLRLGLDPLSAFFIVPLLLLGAVGAVYGAAYLDAQRGRRALGPPTLFYNLLIASMLLVLLARDAIVFLIGWEVMTLASYLLVSFEHQEEDVRRAGWVYLIAAHLGLACVLAMFLLLGHLAGDYEFGELVAHPAGGGFATIAAVLALLGFGVKAGVVPLHVWLPEAHAAAPSHVSGLMSGVLIKLGVYGLLRTLSFLAPASWWGPTLAGLGALSALVGISLALYQRDLKRVLAYSSIENVGVILLGLGVGIWGASRGHPALAALGVFGGLFHVWNHALMKGLLFLGAGSIVHGTGTRDVERMGGLLQRMPRTGALVLAGAVAIAALPPLAGFASEWLIYRALLQGGVGLGAGEGLWMLFAVALLATAGVLAALCFVRLVGVVLLGQPRSDAAAHAHESGPGLIVPMAILAAGAVAMPMAAPAIVDLLAPVAAQIVRGPAVRDVAVAAEIPIAMLSATLWAAVGAAFALLTVLARGRRADETWGCGYAAPTARMQYTGSSFSDTLEQLLPGRLRPRIAVRREAEAFPPPGGLTSDRRDPFTRAAYEPLLDRLARRFARLHWVQHGMLHLYLVYILVTVIGALAAVTFRDWWVGP